MVSSPMTRTLTTLWLTGGGLLATWLAVSPHPSPAQDPPGLARAPVSRDAQPQDLSPEAERLRQRVTPAPPRPSTRNPFRYRVRQPPPVAATTTPIELIPAAPLPPPLTLAGIGE